VTNIKENLQPDNASVQESDVRATLARILRSKSFSRTKRVGQFLSFVVEETLAGRGGRLKAFTIAQEIYDRDETFDPRTDTIVRVEAGRLRHRLTQYYGTEGRNDPCLVELPKGGYTPRFTTNNVVVLKTAIQAQASNATLVAVPGHSLSRIGGVVVLTIIVALTAWILLTKDRQTTPNSSAVIVEHPTQSARLFLVVLPLKTLVDDPMEDRLAAGLVEAIVTDMTKLSGLSVMAHTSLLNLNERSDDLGAIKRDFGATHALRGSLEREDNLIRVNVQLVDIATSTTVWADRLDGNVDNLLDLQDVFAERIVNHLAVQVSQDEYRHLRKRHTRNPEVLALYRQALVLMMPPNDIQRVVTAQHMFQRIIEIDPNFGGGYAGGSFTHSVTALFFKAKDPDRELKKGINLSLRAIEVDPEFGMGYVTLAFAYALSGRDDEALFNARRAIAVQPGDAFTQFVYGMSLTLAGKSHEAIAPLSEAIRLDPAEPRTPYRNVLGIAHYGAGEYLLAAKLFDENLSNEGPTGPHMDAFRAATYAKLGKEEEARSIINKLIHSHPQFPVNSWLAKWHRTSNGLSATMDSLYRLGLPRS
jgi:TolB-like protein